MPRPAPGPAPSPGAPGTRQSQLSVTSEERRNIEKLFGEDFLLVCSAIEEDKGELQPPPSMAEMLKVASHETNTANCSCCTEKRARAREQCIAVHDIRRAADLKRLRVKGPKRASTVYEPRSAGAQALSTFPAFELWRRGYCKYLGQRILAGEAEPDPTRTLFAYVIGLPALLNDGLLLPIVDVDGEAASLKILQRRDELQAERAQERLTHADSWLPVNVPIAVTKCAVQPFMGVQGEQPMFVADMSAQVPASHITIGNPGQTLRPPPALHGVDLLPRMLDGIDQLPHSNLVAHVSGIIAVLDHCVRESDNLYVTVAQNMAEAALQLEKWPLALLCAVAALRLARSSAPFKAAIRGARAAEAMGVPFAAAYLLFEVAPEQRNDLYWQTRRRIEGTVPLAASQPGLFNTFVQHAGKRQLAALLAACADTAYCELRACDIIAAEITAEAEKDVFERRDPDEDPLPQVAPLLAGTCDGEVGAKLNEEAKAWYRSAGSSKGAARRHSLRMALVVWHCALQRMQAWQSGVEESYMLYHALHACGTAVATFINDLKPNNANAALEQYLDISAAAVVATPPMREVADGPAMCSTRRAILKFTAPMVDGLTLKLLKPLSDAVQPHQARCLDAAEFPAGAEPQFIMATVGLLRLWTAYIEVTEGQERAVTTRPPPAIERRARALLEEVGEALDEREMCGPQYEEIKARYNRPDWEAVRASRRGSLGGAAQGGARESAGGGVVKANVKVAGAKGKKKGKGKKAAQGGKQADGEVPRIAAGPKQFDAAAWWMPDAV